MMREARMVFTLGRVGMVRGIPTVKEDPSWVSWDSGNIVFFPLDAKFLKCVQVKKNEFSLTKRF